MKRIKAYAAPGALLLLLGCQGPSLEGVNWPCDANADCEGGRICQAKACVLPTQANGVSNDQIIFGQSGAYLTGPTDLGLGMKIGVEIYFAHVNNQGGVHGRQLVLESHDDGYEPARALENMKAMFEPRRVFAALGNMGSPTAEETFPWAAAHEIPFIAPYTGDPHLRPSPPHKWLFHYRASYREEAVALTNYLLDRRTIAQPGSNIALFAQGTDDLGHVDHFGEAGLFGLSDVLRAAPYSIPEEDIEVWTYEVGARAEVMDEPVQRLLRWLASDAIQADSAGKKNAYVLMTATSQPAAAFVVAARRAFFRVQRDGDTTGDPGGWTLSAEEVTAIQGIDALIFAAMSPATRAFAQGLAAQGTFTNDQGIETPFCEGMIITHVVPHFEAQVALVNEYRQHLIEYGDGAAPGFVSLEGYIAGRLVKEALERVGPALDTEGFLAALEGLGEFDLGLGFPLKFGVGEHQASHRVWGSRVGGADCTITPILDEDFF
ncbi:ABC transporter substrate-binding protein [Myxococcota bacterium]|nr:ABC transporter substrate-binding protein [Myxococcota bacterium]MBU1898685.1 ABC transporter substrate-binding protein [Myxococcota bacterium]